MLYLVSPGLSAQSWVSSSFDQFSYARIRTRIGDNISLTCLLLSARLSILTKKDTA